MLNNKTAVLLVGLTALAAPACSPKAAETPAVTAAPSSAAAAPSSAAMAETPMPATPPMATGAIAGVGKVAAIDAKAGSVKLDHQPISALDWPAMSMTFTVMDHAILSGLSVGDSVSFEIKSPTETTVLTRVEKL